MGSTKPPSLSVGSVYSRIKKVERRTRISRSKVPSHWSGLRMNTASPTILRTRHKFGDFLSQPDLAKFELPKKMSRPWIVNNAFEQEKLKDLIVTERPVEASLVMQQIKESKQERKKQPGYNKKHVRNINDIIEKDQKTSSWWTTSSWTPAWTPPWSQLMRRVTMRSLTRTLKE